MNAKVVPGLEEAIAEIEAGGPPLIRAIHPEDEMYLFLSRHPVLRHTAEQDYYRSGARMLEALEEMLAELGIELRNVGRFLEFACGYGRFTRHLVRKLDARRITGSDLYRGAVDFQRATFGVDGFYSELDPDDLHIPGQFDVIFVASLFSHLPEVVWGRWLSKLYGALNENGVLIFSTHGASGLDPRTSIPESGFLYLKRSESHTLSLDDYGTAHQTPAWVHAKVREFTGQPVELERTRGLFTFQDVYIVRRPGPATPEPQHGRPPSPRESGFADAVLFAGLPSLGATRLHDALASLSRGGHLRRVAYPLGDRADAPELTHGNATPLADVLRAHELEAAGAAAIENPLAVLFASNRSAADTLLLASGNFNLVPEARLRDLRARLKLRARAVRTLAVVPPLREWLFATHSEQVRAHAATAPFDAKAMTAYAKPLLALLRHLDALGEDVVVVPHAETGLLARVLEALGEDPKLADLVPEAPRPRRLDTAELALLREVNASFQNPGVTGAICAEFVAQWPDREVASFPPEAEVEYKRFEAGFVRALRPHDGGMLRKASAVLFAAPARQDTAPLDEGQLAERRGIVLEHALKRGGELTRDRIALEPVVAEYHSIRQNAGTRAIRLAELEDVSLRQAERIVQLMHAIRESESAVRELLGSSSWRLTRPLRAMKNLLSGRRPSTEVRDPAAFDAQWYAQANADVVASGVDPYEHYLTVGRGEGRQAVAPASPRLTEDFDANFYLRQYPDVAASGVDPYDHYMRYGRHEGRLGKLVVFDFEAGGKGFDPNRETVLVVSHEASRTGAPVLSLNIVEKLQRKYNVVSLLMGEGQMVEAFRQESALLVGPLKLHGDTAKAKLLIGQLHRTYPLKYAIANSIESRVVLEALARRGVPSVALIHEFAAYTRPRHAFHEAIFWASETVFSTPLTHDNAVSEIPELAGQPAHILAQGRSLLVTEERSDAAKAREDARVLATLRPDGAADDKLVVIGAGFIQQRKGVDLFIEVAARVLATDAGKRCRFVWIGKGYDPENDIGYSVYLADQLRRSGIERQVVMMDETSSIEVAYDNADVLLISSRLDPLPNVAIDAMAHGLPVICFARTTGFADVLADAGLADECVAPYLDTASMAAKVIALANSPARVAELGERMQQIVAERFDMDRYVDSLDALAAEGARRIAGEEPLVREIVATGLMRRDFFPRAFEREAPAEDLVRFLYLRGWETGIGRRKLFPGFHPGIWQERHGLTQPGLDPLVDWLRAGKPPGPWTYEVIADADATAPAPPDDARVALHLHVYYADLLDEILERLGHNAVRPDLFVSVPSEKVGEDIRHALAGYAGRVVDVQVVPNRGRDIGPFLTAFGPALLADYDLVGHLHTKKTADLADASVGQRWYAFLLENLLGGKAAMADRILGRMAADPSIGMVFPDDPNIVGWGSNQPFIAEIAGRVGVREFPVHFHFPVGTMFWARVEALRPLLELGLPWESYPTEPLPYDGSVLHGLERLFPLVAEQRGHRIALTNVEGVSR